jgi:hypothetical protein
MPLKREKRVELLFRSKGKLDVKLDASAAQKKYPLYRLAIKPLELLDRKHCEKHCEMHPSCSSFVVRLRHFLVTFFCCRKKLLAVGPPPTTLNLKLKK